MSEHLETLRHQLAVLVDALRDDGRPVPVARLQTLIELAEAVLTRLRREILAQRTAEAIPEYDYGPVEELPHE